MPFPFSDFPVGLTFALVWSAVSLALMTYAFHAGKRAVWMCSIAIPVLSLFSTFFPRVIFLNWLFVSAVALFGAKKNWRVKRFVVVSSAATAAAYCIAALMFIPEYRERVQLREQYPIESLTERLAYEKGIRQSAAPGNESESQLSEETKVQIKKFEKSLIDDPSSRQVWTREHSLLSLYWPSLRDTHTGFVHEFINADGFGETRMRKLPAKKKHIAIPETPPIRIEVPAPQQEIVPSSEASPRKLASAGSQKRIAPETMREFHAKGTVDFANQLGYGDVQSGGRYDGTRYIPDLSRVLGFQAHAFRKMPEPVTSPDKTVRWHIEKLELVSLLKHAAPRVYISENLPSMDELRDAPTRALDEFEIAALKKLNEGEAIVVQQQRNQIRMLGPILAANQCLECHNVNRGHLLGAFTYRLRRDPQLLKPVEPTDVSLY